MRVPYSLSSLNSVTTKSRPHLLKLCRELSLKPTVLGAEKVFPAGAKGMTTDSGACKQSCPHSSFTSGDFQTLAHPPSDNGLLLTGSQGNGLCCPPFSPPLSQLHPMSAAMEGTSRVSHLRVSVRSTCSPDSPFIAQEGKETWETCGPPPEKEWQLTGTNSEDSLL